MPFHHVIAKIGTEENFRCLFSDLSIADLHKRFVVPYEQGKSFFSGNDLIAPCDLRSLHIIRTQRLDQTERDEINRIERANIDEINRSNDGFYFFSVGGGYEPQDILQVGNDITHIVINGPPGFKAGRWVPSIKFLAWVGGIIATVFAAGLVKWFGWV